MSKAKRNIGLVLVEVEKTHDFFTTANEGDAYFTPGIRDDPLKYLRVSTCLSHLTSPLNDEFTMI